MGAVNNKQLKRGWQNHWIGVQDFTLTHTASGLVTVDGNAQSNVAVTVTSNGSVADADIIEQISTLKVPGVKMNTAGRTARKYFAVPKEWDTGFPLYFRVHWSSGSSTTADTITWKAFVKLLSANNDQLTATVSTALDTVIAQDTVPVGTAWTLGVTAAGKLNTGAVAAQIAGVPNSLICSFEMDAKAVGLSEDIYLLGAEILYVPRISDDLGQGRVPPLPADWQ